MHVGLKKKEKRRGNVQCTVGSIDVEGALYEMEGRTKGDELVKG